MILFISEQGIQSTHAFVLWYGYLLANTVQTIIIVTKQSYQGYINIGFWSRAPEPGPETDPDLHGARENQNQSVFILIWTLSWYEMLEMTHSLWMGPLSDVFANVPLAILQSFCGMFALQTSSGGSSVWAVWYQLIHVQSGFKCLSWSLKLRVPYVILPVPAIWLTVCSSEESINGDIMLAMKFCMSLIRVFHVWMLARAHIVFKVIHCGNYGGNLAGQQLVGNRDPFRVQTSLPAAPWELHQERGEEGNWGWVGWTQEAITICIEIGLTSASTPSPPYPKSDWTRQMLVEAESRDVGGGGGEGG